MCERVPSSACCAAAFPVRIRGVAGPPLPRTPRVSPGEGRCRLEHPTPVGRHVRPVPVRDHQVVVGLEGAELRCPLRVRVSGLLQGIRYPVGIADGRSVARVRVNARRLAVQGIGWRIASGATGHGAARGVLLLARLPACRKADRTVRVHRAVVSLCVLDRHFQLPFGRSHVEREAVQRGAHQPALGLDVLEVLRQPGQFPQGCIRRRARELVTYPRGDLVVDGVLGRVGHLVRRPVRVRGILELRRLERLQRRKVHAPGSPPLRLAADGRGVRVLALERVQISLQ